MKKEILLLAMLCFNLSLKGQILLPTQTIRGTIIDKESRNPLMGSTLSIEIDGTIHGATSDIAGKFKIEGIPVGRHNIQVSYLGYEPITIRSVMVRSSKEVVLDIELVESTLNLDIVEVLAETAVDKTKPLNPFAAVSSRTFSVEETSRYAAAAYDPARMAQNFAGVTAGATDDLFNEIVIRGNTPSGILWRLEGIEIPNPNHFGSFGNGGGAISMLSSTTLSNSDFYTGAFPAEFGNATSGVFDLNLRNGNNEKRESSFMFGGLGLEFGTEGPFGKDSKSSYIVNYRYSTLAVIQSIGINPTGDVLPTYQDISFKLNFPTDVGVFSIFGLGGDNLAATNPAKDSSLWLSFGDREGWDQKIKMGVIGLSHRKLVNNKSYVRTVIAGTYLSEVYKEFDLDNMYRRVDDYSESVFERNIRLSTLYHSKINAKTSYRIGGIATYKNFSFLSEEVDSEIGDFQKLFDNKTSSAFLQAYAQVKHKFNEALAFNAGLHYSLLTFNKAIAIEPRASLSFDLNDRQQLTISSGLHSKMENLALYTFSGKFLDGHVVNSKEHLGLTKSWHNVVGYDYVITDNLHLKIEAYHQHLYNVPIRREPNSKFSLLNIEDIWSIYRLDDATSSGVGRNIGIDLTFERFFANSHYWMITGSLYDSKYKTHDDTYYNTRFNGNYQLNVLGGREFRLGKKGHKTFGLNGKVVVSGGGRTTEIDLPASIAARDEIRNRDAPFAMRTGTYYRVDLGISYRINREKTSHAIMLDLQNVTNRLNPFEQFYNPVTMRLEEETMTGLFPFLNYRFEF